MHADLTSSCLYPIGLGLVVWLADDVDSHLLLRLVVENVGPAEADTAVGIAPEFGLSPDDDCLDLRRPTLVGEDVEVARGRKKVRSPVLGLDEHLATLLPLTPLGHLALHPALPRCEEKDKDLLNLHSSPHPIPSYTSFSEPLLCDEQFLSLSFLSLLYTFF